jgi:phenylacetate-coenzyme A ligase PaaK-like adenylate-forming protein
MEPMPVITNDAATGLSERFGRTIAGLLPRHLDRLSWSPQQLAAHQREQLRALLAAAVERSPFHARRLAGIDPGRFEPAQLAELPVMTKRR